MDWLTEAVSGFFAPQTEEDKRKKDDDYQAQQAQAGSSSPSSSTPASSAMQPTDHGDSPDHAHSHSHAHSHAHGHPQAHGPGHSHGPVIQDLETAIRVQTAFEGTIVPVRPGDQPSDEGGAEQNKFNIEVPIVEAPKPDTNDDDDDDDGDAKPSMQSEGMLTKQQVLQFCHLIKERVRSPATKQLFKDLIAAGKAVEDGIEQLETAVFTDMRIDPEHGKACFKQVTSTYQHDPQVMVAFQGMMEIETLACDEAELPEGDFKQRLMQFQMTKQQQVLMMRMAGKLKTMMEDPVRAAMMQQKADEHAKTKQDDRPPQEKLTNAMDKLTAARQMMKQNGMDEQAMFQRAFQMLADPNFRASTLQQMQQQQQQQQQQGQGQQGQASSSQQGASSSSSSSSSKTD